MSELLSNLVEFVNMIFAVLVTPNYGAENVNYNLLRFIYYPTGNTISNILLLTFGIMVLGVSIGILRRILWKN